jgi:hypothetical protein
LVERGRQAIVVAIKGTDKTPQDNTIVIRSSLASGSAQIKPLRQHLECSHHQFLRFFAQLPVEFWVIERSHATLKRLRDVEATKNRAAIRKAPIRLPAVQATFGTTKRLGSH